MTRLKFIVTAICTFLLTTIALKGQNTNGQYPSSFEKQGKLVYEKLKSPSNQLVKFLAVLDSVYIWDWDSAASQWKFAIRNIQIIYDYRQNMLGFTRQLWNGSGWVNSSKVSYTYNVNNNPVNALEKKWKSSAWVDSIKSVYYYDANNNNTVFTGQYWNGSAWVSYFQSDFTYDNQNNITVHLDKTLNRSGTTWENWKKFTHAYDDNNNMISDLYQVWKNDRWVNHDLHTFTFDAGNKVTCILNQVWKNNAWVNWYQAIETYENGQINDLDQLWSNSAWVNWYLHTLYYDGNNNNLGVLHQTWNGNVFVNFDKQTLTYDTNSLNNSKVEKKFDNAGNKVIGGDSSFYYFHPEIELLGHQLNIIIFPNPSGGIFHIKIDKLSIINIKIYNVIGACVYVSPLSYPLSGSGSGALDIDLSFCSNGIYFLHIQTEKGDAIKKILISH